MMAKHWLKYNKRWTSTYNTLYLIPSSFIVSFQSAKVKKTTTTITLTFSIQQRNIVHVHSYAHRGIVLTLFLFVRKCCVLSSPFQFDAFAFKNPCYLVLPGLFPPFICALASVNICDLKIEEAPRVIRKSIVFNFHHIFGGNTVQNYVLDFSMCVCICVHLIKIWTSSRCSKNILSSNSEKDRLYRIQSKIWNGFFLLQSSECRIPNGHWTHWVSG